MLELLDRKADVKAPAFDVKHIAFNFTNRCNLRCVYCPQGTHPDEFHADSPHEQLSKIITYVEEHDIKRVSIGYYGETTMIEGWEEYCRPLLDRGIYITLVSNFSKILTPSELDVMSRFSEVQISIDTIDPVLLKQVRKSIDVRNIVYNTQLLRAHIVAHDLPMPRLIWTGVLTDQVVMGVRDLVATAIAGGLKHVNFNDVTYFEAAKNTTRNVYDMPAAEFLAAVALIADARALAGRHGVEFVVASDDHIEQRLLSEFGSDEHRRLTNRLSDLDTLPVERRIFVYGTGEAGRALRRQIADRRELSFGGYIDSFKDGAVGPDRILSFDTYRREAGVDDLILICSMHEDIIEAKVKSAGLSNYLKTHSLFRRNFVPRMILNTEIETVVASGIQGKRTVAGQEFDELPPGMTRLCDSPWTEIYLDPKGEAYSCCQRGTVMGMLTPETTIDDIVGNASYQDLRDQLMAGENLDPECARCAIRRVVTPADLAEHIAELMAPKV